MFSKEYKFGDIIEFDRETGEAIRVIEDGGYAPTQIVRYEGKFQDEKANWEGKGYEVEGMGKGILAVARKYTEQEIRG